MCVRATTKMALIAFFVMACAKNDNDDPVICTAEHVPAFEVYVYDDANGLGISCGAEVIVKEGVFEEKIEHFQAGLPECDNELPLKGVFERVGNYSVTVAKAGYQSWQRSDIEVTEDVCHVITVSLSVFLESN